MSKNIPITSRVTKGSFKNKVTEPLLSVGPAGVFGNNQTSKVPSPAKMKASPFKQQANPLTKNSSGDSKTYESGGKMYSVNKSISAAEIVKGKEITVPGAKYVGVENDWWNSLTPQEQAAHNKKKKAQIAKDPKYQSKTIKQPDTVIPGKEQINVSEATLYTKDKGDAQTALDRRGNIRNIKNLTGQEKRNDMRTLRGGGFKDEAGNVIKRGTQEFKDKKAEIKQHKRDTRAELIRSEIENSKNQSAGNIKASLSGGYSNQYVLSKERVVTAGDKTQDTQRKDFENKAAAEALMNTSKKADAAKSFADASTKFDNTSVSGKDPIKEAGTASAKFPKPEVNADPTDVPAIEKPAVETPAEKIVKGFFAKKSPLKMKYFK